MGVRKLLMRLLLGAAKIVAFTPGEFPATPMEVATARIEHTPATNEIDRRLQFSPSF
jgi:hypothetical protein